MNYPLRQEVFVFVLYFAAILLPFLLFVSLSSLLRWKNNETIGRSMPLWVAKYVATFPLLLTIYHFCLTAGLATYQAREVAQNMNVAVDLNYYTKTSIRATEAYDAIHYAKYDESFYNWYYHGSSRRRLGELDDLVAIYHSGGDSWDNVLTESVLVDICKAEKKFLESQPCLGGGGEDVSSMIQVVFDEDCNYQTSYSESLFIFGLDENALYVEDNISPSHPKSAVLLSYYSTVCKLDLDSIDGSVSSVESDFNSIEVCYAQSELVTDAFIQAGINDVKLSLIAMVVCLIVLSVAVGFKLFYSVLFMLCIVFSLSISAGALPLFGFSYFSAFNVLAIFVITGVGADAIIVFCSSWRKAYEEIKASTFSATLSSDVAQLKKEASMISCFTAVLFKAYHSVMKALYFTVMTTILSFMANLVSPIVVIAQLGAFMGVAMMSYFILLHVILIPAWIYVMKADQYFRVCAPCLMLVEKIGRCFEDNLFREKEAFLESDGRLVNLESNNDNRLIFFEDNYDDETQSEENRYNSSEDFNFSLRDGDVSNDDRCSVLDETRHQETLGSVESHDLEGMQPSCVRQDGHQSSSKPPRKKQSLWLGCGALFGIILSMLAVVYGIGVVLDTDFGLPMLFKEGSNISDLLEVAKSYKSDILTLGNGDSSSSTPNPGTKTPTISPTMFPTHAPTVWTDFPTRPPTRSPTYCPSSSSPTLVPSTLPPTIAPTWTPTTAPSSSYPTASPTTLPPSLSPTVLTSSPTLSPIELTDSPTLVPTFPPTTSVPTTAQPSQSPVILTFTPSHAPVVAPTPFPSISSQPSAFPTVSLPPTSLPSSRPSLLPTSSCPTGRPSCTPSCAPSAPPSGQPTSMPTSPTANPSSSFPSALPSSSPSSEPTCPSAMPSLSPTSVPTSPTSSPSVVPTRMVSRSPTLPVAPTKGQTYYTVYACYGIDIQKSSIDSDATSKVNPQSFAAYAESKLLSDIKNFCQFLSSNRDYMEVLTSDSECLYNELMAVSSDPTLSIYDRIGQWMSEDKERYFWVGVEETGEGSQSGNFGQDGDLWLTWICEPISCLAEVSSFFEDPDHALTMIDRWDYAMYDVGSEGASSMNVVTLTGSESWLFPLLSDRIVSSIYVSSAISFIGCIALILIVTWNLKLALLIAGGMIFIMLASLLLHAIFFSSLIDLIDIIVLISFVGIIIDYPAHMAFHYEHDLKVRSEKGNDGTNDDKNEGGSSQDEDDFHRQSFGHMRFALAGPALTTVFSALPLIFAEFTLLSKAGEYVVIMCGCTYLYVTIVMPTLLRMTQEFSFIPRACRA